MYVQVKQLFFYLYFLLILKKLVYWITSLSFIKAISTLCQNVYPCSYLLKRTFFQVSNNLIFRNIGN